LGEILQERAKMQLNPMTITFLGLSSFVGVICLAITGWAFWITVITLPLLILSFMVFIKLVDMRLELLKEGPIEAKNIVDRIALLIHFQKDRR
jgi:hypothetical protein